jgi:dynactin 1
LVEQSEQLEMTMLDKEMAEERAEAAQAEAELEKEQRAQKEVELEVLKNDRTLGQGAIEGGDPSAKTSLDYIQLEKQNERLKDALVRFVKSTTSFCISLL